MGWRASPSCHHSMIVDPVLGCSSAVPLVPLTEENEEAMENEQFQQLLIKLGVRPPASGQVSTPVMVPAKACCCFILHLLASVGSDQDFDSCPAGLPLPMLPFP